MFLSKHGRCILLAWSSLVSQGLGLDYDSFQDYTEKGYCVKADGSDPADGSDQNSLFGVVKLYGFNPSNEFIDLGNGLNAWSDWTTSNAQYGCILACLQHDTYLQTYPEYFSGKKVTGCEVIWDPYENQGCYAMTEDIDRGNGVENSLCWVFGEWLELEAEEEEFYGTYVPSDVSMNAPMYDYTVEKGYCVTADGQNSLVVQLNSNDGDGPYAQQVCLEACRGYNVDGNSATGCQVIWNQENRGCYVVTDSIDHGSGDENHLCWVFPDSSPPLDMLAPIDCGGHDAPNCEACPYNESGTYMGPAWCNGMCHWYNDECQSSNDDDY